MHGERDEAWAREVLAVEYAAEGNELIAHVLRDPEYSLSMAGKDVRRTIRLILAAHNQGLADAAGVAEKMRFCTQASIAAAIRALGAAGEGKADGVR